MLSTLIGVGGYGCPISCRHMCSSAIFWAAIYAALISALRDDLHTILVIEMMTCMGSLRWYLTRDPLRVGLLAKKKCPPTLLRALGMLRYDVSLCLCKYILLVQYVTAAFRRVATWFRSDTTAPSVFVVYLVCVHRRLPNVTKRVQSTTNA